MTITFTRAQVKLLLNIIAPNVESLVRLADAIGEDRFRLGLMQFGKAPSAKVLRYLDLTLRRGRYEWRVE